MNIYQKLIEVRKSVPYLQKEKEGYQFKYVGSSQVLGSLKSKMDEVGLLLIPNVTNSKVTTDVYDKADNKGNLKRTVDYFTELNIEFTWVNAEKPEETIVCQWYGQGVDTAGEKGVGKALTYAEKYFMLKFFNIPTDKDDPDSFQEKMNDDDSSKTPQKTPQSTQGSGNANGKLSDKQVSRAIAIAKSKGITLEVIKKQILKDYSKTDIADLTKEQYDELCTRLENAGGK